MPDGYSVNSVSSVFKKNWEAPPRPSPVGEGEIGAPPQPSPVGRERLARWELAEFKRLVMWVRRFRVISCRDAASVLSRCAEWYSVKSVSSVFKKLRHKLAGELSPTKKNSKNSATLRAKKALACHTLPQGAVGHAESQSLKSFRSFRSLGSFKCC